ncbi:SDR family oxidoreductase [Ornithinimicrobium faecis]|uniref:SDR family oxidoreductase n=1 Tax=Ornithinimicrobium faecis TaxID=2934158 RepID=A0ABY4YYP7_9MICO|nr:SDR family oxidoreductase [Ornithinimicrobium sp. HY1793]USQ81908.1 SDR family oxidoreductase [Ornithinimicrobium sp. HY1793]
MAIVVTGATGHFGRLVVESLLERGVPAGDILATGRSTERLTELQARGVRTAVLDFDAPADGVLSAGDVLLLVSASEVGQRARQHQNVIDAAVRAGVSTIAYTSLLDAAESDLILAPEHKVTEEALQASGLPVTILRNGWYTENFEPALAQAQATGAVLGSTAGGRISAAPRADFAEAAAVVLTTEGHQGKVYELAGDNSFTLDDLATAFGDVLNTEVSHRDVDADTHREMLAAAGLADGLVGFLVAVDQSTAQGALESSSTDLSQLIGRPTEPLATTVQGWSPSRAA